MMNSSNRKQRAPFREAPADVGNRKSRATPTIAGGNDAHKRRIESPSLVFSKANSRGANRSSIMVKSGARSRSRTRQQLAPPQRQQPPQQSTATGSTNTAGVNVNPNNDATRARVYKAEAYEAKIRLASQEQRTESLQAELEEVKFFQKIENEGNNEAEEREKRSKNDAELIEALAQELETMERDLKISQLRTGELEKDLLERSKSENDLNAARSVVKAQWERREMELKKKLERQQRELNNAKKDTTQGIQIMKELDSALRVARTERDNARSHLTTLRTNTEQMQGKMAVGKELEVALKSMQNERDDASSKLSSSREEVDALKEKCETLEQSNKEVQNILVTVQAQAGQKVEQIKQAVLESQDQEEKLKQDHKNLKESYEQQVKESREMEAALEEMANQLEVQQKKMLNKSVAVEELEDLHATNIENLKQQHSVEIGEMSENERVASSLETRHEQEQKMKDNLLESREIYWGSNMRGLREELSNAQSKNKALEAVEANCLSEIEALKDSLNELKIDSFDMKGPHDELQSENTMLKAGKDDLLRKLQRGLEIHRKTTMELEAKTLELRNLQSLSAAAQAEKEFTDTLKKDYTSAVTLSIERGKKIQLLEMDAGMYKSQLAKLVQKIKKMEKKSQASAANDAVVADKRLQTEVSSLRAKVEESEAKISAVEEESFHSTEKLKWDLTNAQKENDESQSKILNLQEALQDMEAALKTVSSHKFSPRKSPSPVIHEEKRRQIEDGVLKEYCMYRMQGEM